ncbi:3-phenylpropionate/cinnamic acid dioxygenase subunit beta [Bordetella sp. BOR01]|uniref:3-phenylpropionate/cinnamic acid dioxygenase subunit beta n=1 Tax=Bordetella sp. BOR01 TaxID=2854779 RepID=UPI001C477299|nr:3-phenylpropionate/cinnamic acid dioxygenase subunit beta [Bordetella sp. BOR01]MBV7485820.1 3-phenylpropionate/cinnamic acid dioxygenase subunit beta [Bordetella sp. BOR01]
MNTQVSPVPARQAHGDATRHEPAAMQRLLLRLEVEEFLYREADLIDTRRFDDWLATLADDLSYFMPIRRNVKFGTHDERENTRQGRDISWFDEDKWTLRKRVEQIQTGVHWAEEPLSRVCHTVSNVRVHAVRDLPDGGCEVDVGSRFLVYQNRVEYETHFFVGKRNDTLRRQAGGPWQLARREIILDQNVLLAKNLTVFF